MPVSVCRTHAEVHFRVGWLNHYLNISIWFNEGVALLVDYREPYSIASIELSQEQVYTGKGKGGGFFNGESVNLRYIENRLKKSLSAWNQSKSARSQQKVMYFYFDSFKFQRT